MMEIRAVNLQTGITAVRESRPLGTVPPGDSATKKVSITVPNGYDYEIRIRLVEDGAAFATSTGRITLAPPPPQVILADGAVLDSTRSTSPVALPFPTPPAPPTPPAKRPPRRS